MNLHDNLVRLLRETDMPEDTAAAILECVTTLPPLEGALLLPLTDPGDWAGELAEAKRLLSPDPQGISLLTVLLARAVQTRRDYAQAGLPDAVYQATMGCFARFVREYAAYRGVAGFDRDFWVPRQLTMRLFRLGTLEYELMDTGKIELHIPSDASLTQEALHASICAARDFLQRFFPAYERAPMECCSWLLAPALQAMLPPNARILTFQRAFKIIEVYPEEEDCLEWVFRLPPEQRTHPDLTLLSEQTSLQRNIKAYFLSGGHVGIARGILRADWKE